MANKLKVKRGTNLSNITTAPEAGELIYKSNTNELFVGDGSTAANALTSIGGTEYTAGTGLSLSGTEFSLGNHSGDLITSGTVAAARIAGLPASKITSGAFDIDRLPTAAVTNGDFDNVSTANAIYDFVTGQGYLTSSSTQSKYLRSDADDTWSGNISTTSTNGIRFGSANQTDGNDGYIAAGKFASGLNIVGTQTTAGTGRQVRVWGDLIDSGGTGYQKITTFTTNGLLSGRGTTDIDNIGNSTGLLANYSQSGATNKPTGSDHSLLTMSYSSAWQNQIAQDWRNDGRMYIRGQNNGTWSSWHQVFSDDDIIPSSNLDADTAHLSGTQTFSGAKTFSNGINVGGLADGGITGSNYNITGVNAIAFQDPGAGEGITFSNFQIFESPDNLSNAAGNIQFVTGGSSGTRRATIDTSGNLYVQNNITLGGTVDGRDVASDGSKLDGIESGATADQSASEILTAIKTVDGGGSGLDADTLDGVQATNFARKGNTAENTPSNRLTINSYNAIESGSGHQAGLEIYNSSAGNDAFMQFHVSNDYALYFGLDGSTNDLAVGGWSMGANKYKIWHAGNTGSFTGDLVSSERNKGVFGTYDSTKTDHIWSMGTAYRNSSTGADFGNLYGLAYKHTNNTTGGNMAGGHQMVWATNGVPRGSIGEVSIWSKNYFHAAGNYGGSWDTNNNNGLLFEASGSGTAYNVLRCNTDNGFKLQTLGGTGGTQRWYTSGSNYIQFTGTTITASLNGTASNAALLDNIDSSEFLRSNTSDTIGAQLTMGTQTALVASNYGHGVFGVYHATKYQHVWSMGTAYKGPADGASTGTIGNLYGLAWSYNPDYGAVGNNAQSKTGLSHQLLLANNGVTLTALGNGMWTAGHITIGTNNYSLYGIDTSNQVRNLIKLDSSNSVQIGDANTAGVHHHYPSTYSQFNTDYGYLQIGAQNGSHCHYTTDRANHWFNTMIYVNGGVVSSYLSDLSLRRNGASADRIDVTDTYTRVIVNDTERFRVTTGGATVTGTIDVSSNVLFGSGNIWQLDQGSWTGGSANQANIMLSGAAGTFGIHSNTSNVDLLVDGAIRSLSDVVAFYSDIRLKHKFEPITSALEKVQSLEGFTYESNELAKELGYNKDYDNLTGKRKVGVSAQQVQEVLPEAVTLAPFDTHKNEDGTIESKSGEDYLTVKYDKIVPLLIEAIKEQQVQIDELKTKLGE